MERLNELQAIQKDLNENFEMVEIWIINHFPYYLFLFRRENSRSTCGKRKENENYLISVKKDTIEIVKAKKELEFEQERGRKGFAFR